MPHTRRTILLAGAALGSAALSTGCSDRPAGAGDTDSAAGRALLDRGARDSEALLARYDATLTAHPDLGERLRPLREATARHVGAFVSPAATGSASATPAPSRTPSATRSSSRAPEVPKEAKKALAALAEAERHTADRRTAALVGAPPDVARLLASVAAAGAGHVYLLGEDA